MSHILAIDQGTTSSRALVFDRDRQPVALAQQEFPQHLPKSGWVEHDPEDIWNTTVGTARKAMEQAGLQANDIAAMGITNQRETTLVWDKTTGKPVHNAIVWQDRRTAATCAALKADGCEKDVSAKTGLLLDPYFSATKIAWILDTVPGARTRAENGELLFGTVDCYLVWRLTGGRVHATDATNAARTLLYNIHRNQWDEALCALLDVPATMLPDVRDCAGDFGTTDPEIFGGAISIGGVAGDQQAAAIGQACFSPGMMKSTYGTGCFALLNTGTDAVPSANRLLTTIACRLNGVTTYALEGSIFIAGAAVQWLRDGLGIIDSAAETQALAERADPAQDVYLVPAFTGLGAPWWDAGCRGAIYGITRGTGPAELSRAALESVAYQTRDLLEAMRRDWSFGGPASGPAGDLSHTVLRVDGGMTASDWTMQTLADILGVPVDRPAMTETTALGAAWLAAQYAGVWPGPEAFAEAWEPDRRFDPAMDRATADAKYAGWSDAVRRTLTPGKGGGRALSDSRQS